MRLKNFVAAAAVALLATPALAADMTWTGEISDAMCGRSHDMGDKKESAKDCTLECAKADGSYILVVGDKEYKFSNPRFKGIEEHAGEKVTLSGTLKGDTITVTKVEAAK